MEDITDNYRYCPHDTGLKIAPLYVIILRWFLAKFHLDLCRYQELLPFKVPVFSMKMCKNDF